MPYRVFKTESGFCVYKVDDEGNRTGKTLGCHPTKDKAMKQIAAVNISEHSDSLQHYGKKGMRWGIRRKKTSVSSDYKETARLRKKNIKSLSNEELQKAAKRLNLERQFKSLSPSKSDIGKKVVGDIIGGAAKATLTGATMAAFGLVGKKLISIAMLKFKG